MMMETDGELLGPDFAPRVVARVRQVKRRRRIYRWVLASAAAGALPALILWLPARNSSLVSPAGTAADVAPDAIALAPEFSRSQSYRAYYDRPLAFFFPSAATGSDLQTAEAGDWHSYDPWWTSNP